MSQLGLGLGLTRGGGVPFNPLSLNPYLLFDTRSSMIGTFENPTLDLDPSKPDTLNVITATRAGTATYTDADGVIQAASPDTVRVDHVDGVPMMLIEPSATNLVLSNDFYAVSTTSITAGFEAPDGSNDAIEISNILDADGDRAHTNIATIAGSTQYAGSLYVKGTAGEVISFFTKRYSAGAYSTSAEKEVLLTGDWQRVTDMLWTSSSDNTNGVLVVNKRPTTTADVIQVWGPQIESGSVSTSVIPTSGSTVTRAADDLVITGSAFSDFYNQSEGTFYVESVPNENTSGSFLFDLTKISGESERLLIYNGGSNQKVYISTASTNWVDNIIGTRPAGGVLSRVAISYETNNVQASLDGVNMVPDTSATMSTSIGKMTIGNRYETSRYLNGRIRRLIFWPYSSDRL
jgi:hypothetical protein